VLSDSGFRVNSSGLAAGGYRVVCEVFAGALAGLLHDGALWLRPPKVRRRIRRFRRTEPVTRAELAELTLSEADIVEWTRSDLQSWLSVFPIEK